MSNADAIRKLSKQRKDLSKKKQIAEKRKRGVDKAISQVDEMNTSKFSTTFENAVNALKKGLKPLDTSFDAGLPTDKNERNDLSDESYRLGRNIYKYQSQIDDIDYKIRNMQIEEG